ncbi:peptidase domain-containing ABC transporter [Paludibacterium purpuratum]|uniref:Colicin V processing peptidase n=1 Tax=Paludibacterium purpuratum TaxID=1144873 RepID=A0A4R7AW67_9NEIS|nr:peptidase domain-containing ABC transporter [Paludibacterium purpuratum]TDR71604.1 colicin V processing peptidase [Paludibacterium purpuratum]
MVNLKQRLAFGPTLPVVLQTEAAECGLAALAMVAGYHGHRIDLLTLRRRFATSLKGMTLADLVRTAEHLGMAGRALRLELAELSQLQRPAILHWNLNHYVVLARVAEHGIVIHDPVAGRRHINWHEVSRHFTGIALELSPTAAFRKIEETQYLPWRHLLAGTTGWRQAVAQIFLLALMLELLALATPLFSQWLVDSVLLSADQDMLKVLVVGFLLVVMAQALVSAVRAWAVLQFSTLVGLQWTTRIFSHLLRLPLAWFEKRFIGDISSRFQGAATIQQTLSRYFIEALLDGLLVIGTLCVMLRYSTSLAMISCIGLATYGLLRWAWYGHLREVSEKLLVLEARQDGHLLETLRGIQAVKLFQRLGERRSAWLNLLIERTNTHVKSEKLAIAYHTSEMLLLGLQQAAVLWFGASLVLDQSFSVGMYLAFTTYSTQFATRMAGLIGKAVELKMLRLQVERLADIVLSEPDPPPRLGTVSPADSSIEFRHVSFRFAPNEPWLIRDLSFTIRDGESVALVGPSGCGKTTLLKMVLGIFQPIDGEILIGGVPLRALGHHGILERCACVMQNDQLFAGSILDNIAFFDPQPDLARVEACAQSAALHATIMALPMAYHTLVGDMGTTLSGGQKQRLLLARALYRQPHILLLDEATSHLDVDLERQINHAVALLNMTRVLIAHRPETIASAERAIHIGQAARFDI